MEKKLYGSIKLIGNNWVIDCEPHVKTKLKRVFPQVRQSASQVIMITNNQENCHDLLWFIDRYPMKVENLKHLKGESKKYKELKNDILDVLNYSRPTMQFQLAEPAFTYQASAAELLLQVRGLLLADELGLGKTVSSICPMLIPENLPALFVTLTHLPSQIQAELKRFAPHLKTHILTKTTPYPLSDEGENPPDVIICSYSKLNGWAEQLRGKVNYVILDEIQELRTGDGSLKYIAAKHIAEAANLRMGLSGTPIYGYGHEFYNVLSILRPNILGTREEFIREWCNSDNNIFDPKAFGTYLREEGIMLRRTREDVKKDRPRVPRIPQYIDADTKILDEIKGHAIELAKIILNSTEQFRGQKFRATEEFNMLMRQATGIAKAPYVAEFVRMLVESGESVILCGWHRDVYNIWLERLKEFNPAMYTGTESITQKEKSKQAFLSGESKVLIISNRSGAGLDGLQYHPTCKTIVIGELDWSPGVHDQCIGRLDRDGQTKEIVAFFLLTDSGSDPIIADIIGVKKMQLENVRDPNINIIEELEIDKGGIKQLASSLLDRYNIASEAK